MRAGLLPYGRQTVTDEDVEAVVAALHSGWLTTGPEIARFEADLANFVGTPDAVAVSSGTAALHAMIFAMDIGPGDEVIVPAITFAATANCVVYQGGTPIFADVEPDTLLLSAASAAERVSDRTRLILGVDYAGQPCDYGALAEIGKDRDISVLADACHSIGGADNGVPVGQLATLSAFSFHPVKAITSGEGGAVVGEDRELLRRVRTFRSHGITTDFREREERGSWFYEMTELGYNYRLTDIQCALARTQLQKLPGWIRRRNEIAAAYDRAFAGLPGMSPLARRPNVDHGYHLYVIRLDPAALRGDRGVIFRALRAEGIGANVHYVPVHLHPYYQRKLGTRPGLCPAAEAAYESILSLPVFSAMDDQDVDDVVEAVKKVFSAYGA